MNRLNSPFAEPMNVAALLTQFDRPWYVAGGWAIDLFLRHQTREHKDIEIAILREDQWALREHLAGWHFVKVVPRSGGLMQKWDEGEWLRAPTHEIHAKKGAGQQFVLEILLNESSGDQWLFRRNQEITRPLAVLGHLSEIEVPFLSPEIVLLYKAGRPTEHDEADFSSGLPLLGKEPRHWLSRAIDACYPNHQWVARLEA